MKKILILLSLIVFVTGIVICFSEIESDLSKKDQVSFEEEQIENQVSAESSQENSQIKEAEKIIEEEKEVITEIQKVEKKDSGTSTGKENNTSTKTETKKTVEEKVVEHPKIEEKQEPVVPEESTPQVDEVYEQLLKQVEYKTYQECLDAGFKIALQDTVNILGFTPQEIVYKGQILGYKLHIDYTNPMEN